MDRVRFIEHKGKRIALLDFSGMTDVESGLATIADATSFISNSSLHRAAISMIAIFSRRKLEVFDSRPDALDWLTVQP